ncbi:MAG: serine/threonine protein kinase [Mariniblastus sp.]|jgi:serine/threonine protein kinase
MSDEEFENVDDSMVDEDLSVVESACESYIELYREGTAPTLEDFVAQHENHAEQILELLPTVLMMEDARARSIGRRKDGMVKRGAALITELGDFEIVREIGRGGMGIVYEAVQRSLDRSVALKLLPKHVLNEEQIEKFKREASTAAKLHHTNIAPIYGVGESGGSHYYAMQLLEGIALDRYVTIPHSDLKSYLPPLTIEEAVDYGRQVASALQYAHEQGVLHRDIKPSNLLLDHSGNVWMTDFGLAISLEESNYESGATASGTLRYNAPEKFGERAGSRTADIYSLGITLIELLSGKPAFTGMRIRELTDQIVSGQLAELSHHGQRLPRDLEAVLRKAVALEPRDRYHTAQEFEDDLRNLAETRPVNAKRSTATSAVVRWAQRNRGFAITSCVAAVLLIATSLITSYSYFNVQDALDAKQSQLMRARNSSLVASRAIDKMFEQFTGNTNLFDGPLDSNRTYPALTSETAAFAKELSDFYLQLASQNRNDTVLPIKALSARTRVGELNERLGRYDEAAESYRVAINGYKSLMIAEKIPNSKENVIRVARLANQIGLVKRITGGLEDSSWHHQNAINMLTKKLASEPNDLQLSMELARSYYASASRIRPGMGPRSLPPASFSILAEPADLQSEMEHFSQERKVSLQHAVDLLNGIEDQCLGQMADARDYLSALCFRELAGDNWSMRTDTQSKYYSDAIANLKRLIEKYPNSLPFQFELVGTLSNINVFDTGVDSETVDKSFSALLEAREICELLASAEPDVSIYQLELIHCHFKIGKMAECKREFIDPISEDAEFELKWFENAEAESLQRAFDLHEELASGHPNTIGNRAWAARFALSYANCDAIKRQLEIRHRYIATAVTNLNRLPESDWKQPNVALLKKEASHLSRQALVESQ